MMASIYAEARRVLVLDSELTATKFTDVESLLAHIVCSVWMCRSWTLQEGLLAKGCTFQLANGLYTLEMRRKNIDRLYYRIGNHLEIWQERQLSESEFVEGSVSSGISPGATRRRKRISQIQTWKESSLSELELYFLKSFFGISTKTGPRSIRFHHMWNALAGRSTTQQSDVFIVLANMLDFSCSGLCKLEPALRLPAIVLALNGAPLSLFFNTGPRYKESRFHANRWVPAELTRDICVSKTMLRRHGQTLGFGYNAEATAYMLCGSVAPFQRRYIVHDEKARISMSINPQYIEGDKFKLDSFSNTCVIIENKIESEPGHQYRAAILYSAKPVKICGWHKIQLMYCCPATVQIEQYQENATAECTKESDLRENKRLLIDKINLRRIRIMFSK